LAIAEAGQYLNEMPNVNEDLASLGIEGFAASPNLANALLEDTKAQMTRLLDLEVEIASLEHKLKDQFNEFKAIKYRLAAVFFHRGSYGHGHYWIYIHDFENNMWRVYNDEKVEEFKNVNEILEANTWNHGTPTFAVYVQDQHKTDVIQPVCRAPEAAPESSAVGDSTNTASDVEMEDMVRTDGTLNLRDSMIDHNPAHESSGEWDQLREVPTAEF
jgi:ubiquitin carboxyl-terminal hydrolase 25/28